MLKIISANLNGIRSAAKKGFFSWITKEDPDFICLQETKAQLFQLDDPLFQPVNYQRYFVDPEKKGYSGVAIYSKHQPLAINTELGWETASIEGRYIELSFPNFKLASIYLPSGSSGELRQTVKYDFLDNYKKVLQRQAEEKIIICGDFNIAHQNIDLVNWRQNQKCSGFLPEERAWLDYVLTELKFIDSFRKLYPEKIAYTWWSMRSKQARAKNIGWRIDYQLISSALAENLVTGSIYQDEVFSDHAPVIMEYDLKL